MSGNMLGKIRARLKPAPPVLTTTNYTSEHVRVANTLKRRRKIFDFLWRYLPMIRLVLGAVGILWLFALPYEGLWQSTFIDEHALQPAQVTMYFDWGDVHRADRYLEKLEGLVDASFNERSAFISSTFASAGHTTGNTSQSTWAHVVPPRSAGTETILVSANWVSRDGTPNLRGIATLLALSDFLRGQNHWAFDFALVVGDSYITGLSSFSDLYPTLFPGVIWTALNIDYPGHSFTHIGVFYEGVNGRLPNQDVPNTVAHVGRWAGGADMRIHNVDNDDWSVQHITRWVPEWMGEGLRKGVASYVIGAKHLWEHATYAALGKASGAHGVFARHRIDATTLYCTPSTGPHGFHTLGRTLESTLRSFNNLLERLHASYFFYLIPRPGKFIPVGHYLPSAVLIGASITLGGFDCPTPLEGIIEILPSFIVALICWILGNTIYALPIVLLGGVGGRNLSAFAFGSSSSGDSLGGKSTHEVHAAVHPSSKSTTASIALSSLTAKRSTLSLLHLLYGALIPTLAMVNYPQATLLALITLAHLALPRKVALAVAVVVQPVFWSEYLGLREEWQLGNMAWPGVFAIWLPLWCTLWRL